jgi:penicillin-binding protein 1A
MSDLSWVAAKLWGKIMGQIPKACQGTYPSAPANVVKKGGYYFTKGTDTGLTTYKSPETLKKEREEKKRKALEAQKQQELEQEDVEILAAEPTDEEEEVEA